MAQKVYYLHGDHLGSGSLTTNNNGASVSACRYYPYGQERGECESANGRISDSPTRPFAYSFGFTGQRNEGSFGLMDYNARYYSPRLGRFVSPDPIIPGVASQDWNRYSYVKNNPIRYNDPTGHCFSGTLDTAICIGIAAAIVVVGMAFDPAEVLAPDDQLAANHPPLAEGYYPIGGVREFEHGEYAMGATLMALEVTPMDEIPGVQQAAKVVGKSVALGLTRTSEHGDLLYKFVVTLARDYHERAYLATNWKDIGLSSIKGIGNDFPIAFKEAMNNADKIHFNLTGLDTTEAWNMGSKPWSELGTNQVTDWEFYQILKNESYLQKTSFYNNGKLLTPEEVEKMIKGLLDQ